MLTWPLKQGRDAQVVAATGSGVVSLAVTENGHVFTWGTSKRGQLGLGRHVEAAPQPRRVPGLLDVVLVAAGWGHALALTGVRLA